MEFDDVKYDRQLVQLLDLLKETNLKQFIFDLSFNDPIIFKQLKELIDKQVMR